MGRAIRKDTAGDCGRQTIDRTMRSEITGHGDRCGDGPASINERLCDLLEAVGLDRDPEAFAELFRHLAPRIRHRLMGRGASPAMAEELMQEAMLAVWRRAHTFDRSRASGSTWVFTIAHNKHLDRLRAMRVHGKSHGLDGLEIPSGEPGAEQILQCLETGEILRRAIKGLRGDQEQILRKAFDEAKSHREIATELDLPLGTVKSRIRLALAHLRTTLPLAALR
jgi:RNA polymerase sigma-70 factor (ECF subfamily)